MKVTSTTQLTATLDDGTELDLDHNPADHIEPSVTIEGDTLTLRYAVVDDYHSSNPLDEECSGASLLEFRNGSERDEWLDEHELSDRQFLVERYEHGLVSYSVLDTGNYPDRRWDVARGVGVLTLDDEWTAPDVATANSVLDEYTSWCNGDVYGIVTHTYRRGAEGWKMDHEATDSCWGFIGTDYATEAVARGDY